MSLAKLAYRTSVHVITKRILFFINKEFEANTTLKKLTFNNFITEINILIKELQKVYNELCQDIKFFNTRIKKYADNSKVRELTLKKKNKVYLLRRTLNTKITFI